MNRKEELLINAAKIIYEEGIQKLTLDYVAEVSDLTKGGVLYHFKSKRNLLVEMNKLALKKFENLLDQYVSTLKGKAIFTRAYAYSTLDFFNNPEITLLPAVFISSLEDEACLNLWEETSKKWEHKFAGDSGDPQENLKLQLICDGIWFSILYGPEQDLDEEVKSLVLHMCESLEEDM